MITLQFRYAVFRDDTGFNYVEYNHTGLILDNPLSMDDKIIDAIRPGRHDNATDQPS